MSDERFGFTRRFLLDLSKRLADEGKLIEAGWISLRAHAIPVDAPEVQVKEMRMAFMAGAQHVFHSIVAVLDEDAEPTEADLRRMDLIHAELTAFYEEMKADPRFAAGLRGL